MATWPEIIRNKPRRTLIVVATALLAVWLIAIRPGPFVWVPLAVLATAFALVALYRRYQWKRAERARAKADTFSFGDVVIRMRARAVEEEALAVAKRRERIPVAS